jgi:glycosyltransferase involved in cell wall biosynthesis
MTTQPLVSVRLVAYNHEKWIAQCLESILMQRTDFPFEVIVGEDCSTDRTREIVLAYAGNYPDKIRVLPSEANLGHMLNSYRVQQACRGKYHAMIEGDDYWIDPLKLQKQADFMEAHPDVSLCFHNALILNETHAATRLFFETPFQEILDFEAVYQVTLPMASLMARSDVLATLPDWRLKIWCGDLLFRLWCAHHGNFGYFDQIMSVYRRHAGGMALDRQLQGHRAYFDDVYYTLQEFDKATHFAHTDLIQREIARLKEIQVRHRIRGRWYYLARPSQIIARFKRYADWIDRQEKLFR